MAANDDLTLIRSFLASITRPNQRSFDVVHGGRKVNYSLDQILQILPRVVARLEPGQRDRLAPLLTGKSAAEIIPFLYSSKNTNKELLELSNNGSNSPLGPESEVHQNQDQRSESFPVHTRQRETHPDNERPIETHAPIVEAVVSQTEPQGAAPVSVNSPSLRFSRQSVVPLQRAASSRLGRVSNSLGTLAARNPKIAQSMIFGGAMGALGFIGSGFNPTTAAAFAAGGALAPHWKSLGIGSIIGNLSSGIVETAENLVSNRENVSSDQDRGGQQGPTERGQGSRGGPSGGSRQSSRRFLPISRFWWWAIIVTAVVLAFMMLVLGQDKPTVGNSIDPLSAKNLEISKVGPAKVENGHEITYKITIKYLGDRIASIKVSDQVPQGTKFVDTSSRPTAELPCQTKVAGAASGGSEAGQNITWSLADITPQTSIELCLTLLPTDPDIYVVNTVTAAIDSVVGGSSSQIDLEMTGPPAVANTETPISYPIILTYRGEGSGTFEVYDKIPDHTKFLDADAKDSCESQLSPIETVGTVKWADITLKKGESIKLCLTLSPTDDKVKIENRARAVLVNQTGPDPGAAGNVPPNNDSCGGKYTATINKNALHKNYGDPSCTFTKDDLYTLLKQQDPQHADFWFNHGIECESSFDANNYNPPANGTPDAGGAWGLFQMGRGKNGPFDHGDVNWPLQVSNEANYFTRVLVPNGLNLGAYFDCARKVGL